MRDLAEETADRLLGNCQCGAPAELQQRADGKFDRLRQVLCRECAIEIAELRWREVRCVRCSELLDKDADRWRMACEVCRRSRGIMWENHGGVPIELR